MAKRYPAPTGYAPAGVSYYNSGNTKPKRKVYAPPTGYAPGGVEYGPLRRKPKKKLQTSVYTTGGGKKAGGGRPIGTTESGEVIYQDPNTGEIYTQAEKRVHERTDPILQELARREAEERARAQADAQAYSQQVGTAYANERAPTAALYDHAVQQAKDVENAIAAKFGKTGETNVDELKAKLAQIGGATGADEAAQAYTGAGNANYAIGMNDVARLISRGAEAQNYLEREGLNAQQGIQADLADLLQQIAGDYSDQRFEISAGMPGQIQDMYDQMLADARGQAQGKYERGLAEKDRATEEKRYRNEQQSARAAAVNEQYNKDREYLLKQKALAINDPMRTKFIDAQIKALDRQAKIDIANANREAANARTAAGLSASASAPRDAAANEKWITDAYGNIIGPNPNYVPPKKTAKGKGQSKSDVRLRRKQAWSGISGNVVDPYTKGGDWIFDKESGDWIQEPPERGGAVPRRKSKQIVSDINAEIRAAGIGINTPTGIALRKQALAKLGIPTGPNGNPSFPTRRKPRGGR